MDDPTGGCIMYKKCWGFTICEWSELKNDSQNYIKKIQNQSKVNLVSYRLDAWGTYIRSEFHRIEKKYTEWMKSSRNGSAKAWVEKVENFQLFQLVEN